MATEEPNEKKVQMLKQIAEYYKITRNIDFARYFGISAPTAFFRLKNGFIDYEEIYTKCPEISADWLLSGGEGPMLRADRAEVINASQNNNIGAGASQYISTSEGAALEKVTAALHREQEALSREQEALSKSQEHISGLIKALNRE